MKTLTLIIIALLQLTNACHLKRHSTIQHTTDIPFSNEDLHQLIYKITAKLQHLAIVTDSAESFSYWDHVTYDRVMVDYFQKETPGSELYLSIFFDYSDIEIAFVKQTSKGGEILHSSTFTFSQSNQQKPSNPHQQKTHTFSSRKFPVNIPEVSASDLPEVPSFEHLQSLHNSPTHDSDVKECKRENIYYQGDVDIMSIQDSDQYVNISSTNIKLEDTSAVPICKFHADKQDSIIPSSLALPGTSTSADLPSIPANEAVPPVSKNEILSTSKELPLFEYFISNAIKKFIGTSRHRYKTFISYAPRCCYDSHSVYLKLANSKNLNLNVVYCIDIAIASLIASMQQNPKITVHFYAGKDPVSAYLDADQTISHIRWNEFDSLNLPLTKTDITFLKEHNRTIKNMQYFTSPSDILQFAVHYLQRNHNNIYELVKSHLTYSMLCAIVNPPEISYHIMYSQLNKSLAETLYRAISEIFVRAAQCFATMIVATAEISMKKGNHSVHVSVNGWIYENNQYLADRIRYWVKELDPLRSIEIVRDGSRKGFKCLAPVIASSVVSEKYLAQRRVSVF